MVWLRKVNAQNVRPPNTVENSPLLISPRRTVPVFALLDFTVKVVLQHERPTRHSHEVLAAFARKVITVLKVPTILGNALLANILHKQV